MSIKELTICSQRVAERIDPEDHWGIISIRGPRQEVLLKSGWDDVLELEFNDITRPFSNFVMFNERHARSIINWSDYHLDDLDHLVIHCEQGVSRSQAVGLFIQSHYCPHLPALKNASRYNDLVLNTLTDVYRRSI